MSWEFHYLNSSGFQDCSKVACGPHKSHTGPAPWQQVLLETAPPNAGAHRLRPCSRSNHVLWPEGDPFKIWKSRMTSIGHCRHQPGKQREPHSLHWPHLQNRERTIVFLYTEIQIQKALKRNFKKYLRIHNPSGVIWLPWRSLKKPVALLSSRLGFMKQPQSDEFESGIGNGHREFFALISFLPKKKRMKTQDLVPRIQPST